MRLFWIVAAALVLAGVGTAHAQPRGADEPGAPEEHVVQSGETLSGIAAQHGVSIEQLVDHNEGLDPDRIRAGQRLKLGEDRVFHDYRVQSGDTLSGIARRYDVTLDQLARWNPGLQPDRIRSGQALRIYRKAPRSLSESVGTPADGELKSARKLPRHRGYIIREQARAWGTDETVQAIVDAFDHVVEKHARAARVKVHDLSLRSGGPMDDHRSHQSGRDVDIAYFQRECADGVCSFRSLSPASLDVERTWTLLQYWLERDMLEAAFIDYSLQAALYRHARSRGASRDDLARWFQYPSGRGSILGVIRHVPKHTDHMHVRFTCHQSDPECKTYRPLLTARTARR